MKTKVGVPIVIAAVIGLIVILVIMGKTFLKGPEAVVTAPPPWIDAATGKPKAQMGGSGATSSTSGSPALNGSAPAGPGR